jgi:uncharacterized glyoxalase superfamily protein PhnB
MPKVNPIPPGQSGLLPHLVVESGTKALEFYRKAFGGEELYRIPSPCGTKVMHAEMRLGDSVLMIGEDAPEQGPPRNPKALRGSSVTIHRYVADTDAAVKRAVEAGATLKLPPTDMFWGDRYGAVTDPFGHEWSFATRQKELTPEQIAEAARSAFGG